MSHNFSFPQNVLKVEEILGAEVPTMRITGLIKSTEEEKGLMTMWHESRSDIWQWFDSPEIHDKVVIHDLTINRRTGVYTVDIQKYSGESFRQQSNL